VRLLELDGSFICEITNLHTVATDEGTTLEGDVPMSAAIDPTSELMIENVGERMRFIVKAYRRRTPLPGRELAVAAARVRGLLVPSR
jgi:hypothetical protein